MDNPHNYDYARNHARCVPSLPPFPFLTLCTLFATSEFFRRTGGRGTSSRVPLLRVGNSMLYIYKYI